jgi:hypothetical protein
MGNSKLNKCLGFSPKVVVATVIVAMVLAHPAKATESVSMDGNWWTALTSEEQVIAVQALMEGFEEGYNTGYIGAGVNDVMHYHSTRSQAQLPGDPVANVHFSKAFGVYQQEITDFYSQHTDAMTITTGQVMDCLVDNPSYTCDQVAKWQH